MKDLFFILLITLPIFASAQQTEGKIIYEETVQLQIDIPEEHRQMMGNIPTSQSAKKVLCFTEKESFFQSVGETEDKEIKSDSDDGDIQIKIVFSNPESFYYKNIETKNKVVQQEFMGRNFLIKDELDTFKWKLTTDQKIILNYPCTKAVYQDSTQHLEAWFTAQIPVSNGPDGYGQLPGMILELSVDEGDRTYVAQSVVFEKPLTDILQAPTKGKKVNQAEFDEIVEIKNKEMEEQMGGNGRMMRIRN